MMSLAQIAQNKKQHARTAFINAAWSEEPPERLAELANDAGMELAAADARLSDAERAHAKARSALEQAVEQPR